MSNKGKKNYFLSFFVNVFGIFVLTFVTLVFISLWIYLLPDKNSALVGCDQESFAPAQTLESMLQNQIWGGNAEVHIVQWNPESCTLQFSLNKESGNTVTESRFEKNASPIIKEAFLSGNSLKVKLVIAYNRYTLLPLSEVPNKKVVLSQKLQILNHLIFFITAFTVLLLLVIHLKKRSIPFYQILFKNHPEEAKAASLLKHFGIFLFCLALLLLLLPYGLDPSNLTDLFEDCSFKFGFFLILLAFIQIITVKNYWKIAQRSL